MPELPEVETVMRGLQTVLEHERIVWAETRRDGMRFPFPPRLAERLRGRRVVSFRRRAKYILMRLEGGESLLIHLGMSGRMVARPTTMAGPSSRPKAVSQPLVSRPERQPA